MIKTLHIDLIAIAAAVGILALGALGYLSSQGIINLSAHDQFNYKLEKNQTTEYLADTGGNWDGVASFQERLKLEMMLNQGEGIAWIDPNRKNGLYASPEGWSTFLEQEHKEGKHCDCPYGELYGIDQTGRIMRQFKATPSGSQIVELPAEEIIQPSDPPFLKMIIRRLGSYHN